MRTIHMGLNRDYKTLPQNFEGYDEESIERLKKEVEICQNLEKQIHDAIVEDGRVSLSWDCTGRTRHMTHAMNWEYHLPQYDFDISYNYGCIVTHKSENKVFISMLKDEDNVFLRSSLFETKEGNDKLNEIRKALEDGKKVYLTFPKVSVYDNYIFYHEDIMMAMERIDFIERGRIRSSHNPDVAMEFVIETAKLN